jgi:hypothetical protein
MLQFDGGHVHAANEQPVQPPRDGGTKSIVIRQMANAIVTKFDNVIACTVS